MNKELEKCGRKQSWPILKSRLTFEFGTEKSLQKENLYSVNANHDSVEGKRESVKLKPTFSLGFVSRCEYIFSYDMRLW